MDPFISRSLLTSSEIFVKPYKSGVQLLTAESTERVNLSLEQCFALPFSVYLLNKKGETLLINDVGAEICGFKSSEEAKGQTIFSVAYDNASKKLLDNCDAVITHENLKLFDEYFVRHDGKKLYFVSFKFPCYNQQGLLSGVLGFSIVVGTHAIAEAIESIQLLGLMPKVNLNLHGTKLTNREKECLRLTVNGYSAKAIANRLGISVRTVEDYLKNIKLKFNVYSKQQLIDKVCG